MLNYEYTPENVIIRDKNDLKSKLQQYEIKDIKKNIGNIKYSSSLLLLLPLRPVLVNYIE
jgi:hypothetical protein